MGHHQQCGARTLQVVLKPLDSGDIQVVGRLVKNQEIRLRDNGPRQRQTLALTARKVVDTLVGIGQPEAGKELFQTVLVVPGMRLVHFMHNAFGCCRIARSQIRVIAAHKVGNRVIGLQSGVNHTDTRRKSRFLGKIAYSQTAAVHNFTAVGSLVARKNTQQRTFACAVSGDDTYFIALLHSKSYIAEEQAVAVALGKILDVQ